jgi:hypothetical protein
MRDDVKEVLSDLQRAYQSMDYDSRRDLWHILTALRGPDNGREDVKSATTGIIRAAVFGLDAGRMLQEFAVVEFFDRLAGLRVNEHALCYRAANQHEDNWHFINHAQKAFRALGLTWETNNRTHPFKDTI